MSLQDADCSRKKLTIDLFGGTNWNFVAIERDWLVARSCERSLRLPRRDWSSFSLGTASDHSSANLRSRSVHDRGCSGRQVATQHNQRV